MKSNRLCLVWAAAGLLCGCRAGTPQEIRVREIPPGRWSASEAVEVFFENADTLGSRTVEVLVRLRNDFACDRLDFALETLTPDSLVWRDTLSVPFPKGEITETVSFTYTDVKTPYRTLSRLARPGRYRFRFTPAGPAPCAGEVIGVGIEISSQ